MFAGLGRLLMEGLEHYWSTAGEYWRLDTGYAGKDAIVARSSSNSDYSALYRLLAF